MSKKTQTILTICVDISMLAVIVTASYLLLTGKLQGNWIHVAQIAIIAAIPTLFFVSFLNFGMQKYEKMRPEDAWEDENDERWRLPRGLIRNRMKIKMHRNHNNCGAFFIADRM